MVKGGEWFEITLKLPHESVHLTPSEIPWMYRITIQVLLSFLSVRRVCRLKIFFTKPCR